MVQAAKQSGREDRLLSKVFSYSSSFLQSHSLYGLALACQNSHSAIAPASHSAEMNSMLFGGLEDGMEQVSAFLISPLCVHAHVEYTCCCLYSASCSGVHIRAKVRYNPSWSCHKRASFLNRIWDCQNSEFEVYRMTPLSPAKIHGRFRWSCPKSSGPNS
jgi:hypothetical protein